MCLGVMAHLSQAELNQLLGWNAVRRRGELIFGCWRERIVLERSFSLWFVRRSVTQRAGLNEKGLTNASWEWAAERGG